MNSNHINYSIDELTALFAELSLEERSKVSVETLESKPSLLMNDDNDNDALLPNDEHVNEEQEDTPLNAKNEQDIEQENARVIYDMIMDDEMFDSFMQIANEDLEDSVVTETTTLALPNTQELVFTNDNMEIDEEDDDMEVDDFEMEVDIDESNRSLFWNHDSATPMEFIYETSQVDQIPMDWSVLDESITTTTLDDNCMECSYIPLGPHQMEWSILVTAY